MIEYYLPKIKRRTKKVSMAGQKFFKKLLKRETKMDIVLMILLSLHKMSVYQNIQVLALKNHLFLVG